MESANLIYIMFNDNFFSQDPFNFINRFNNLHSNQVEQNFGTRLFSRLSYEMQSYLKAAKLISNKQNASNTSIEHLFVAMVEAPTPEIQEILSSLGIESTDLYKYAISNLNDLSQKFSENTINLNSELSKLLSFCLRYEHRVSADIVFKHILQSNNQFINDILNKFSSDFKNSKTETSKNNEDVLDEFGVNLSKLAKEGKISPVIGRSSEIDRAASILCRKSKNNPLLLGEPGVGKTAIAEGLALLIHEGKAPKNLQNKTIFALDVANLVAGTKFRGAFEENFKKLIDALKTYNGNIIVFIDEVHTIVGAGATEGQMDIANLLKPSLARNEFAVIGATTLKEYKKYIQTDAALDRRFQAVDIKEPTVCQAIDILNGLKASYEDFHKISIDPMAIKACVELSDRYIKNRFLPDKAIDILDEACARKSLKHDSVDTGKLEKDLKTAVDKEDYKKAAELKQQIAIANEENSTGQISEHDIKEVISQMAKVPLSNLGEKALSKLSLLSDNLKAAVIGQDQACEAISNCIIRSKANLNDPNRPLGSFLFLGPTGVGKTEITKTLALELFGNHDKLIRLDMSEFMEEHSVSKLIGAPAGYVGYAEGGYLTEKVANNPYSIILIDEIEKAHKRVLNILLQILDDGRLTDNQGRTVNFKNTVIIATSNVGAKFILETPIDSPEELETLINSELINHFSPELINRFDETIIFNKLTKPDVEKITQLQLTKLEERLLAQNIKLILTQSALKQIAELGFDQNFGARPLKRFIQKNIENPVANLIISDNKISEIKVGIDKNKKFVFKQK